MTGQRFDIREIASASGAGFAAYDVIRADASGVLFALTTALLPDPSNQRTMLTGVSGFDAGASGAPDLWWRPDQLAAMVDGNGVRVVRLPCNMAGQEFSAIRIATDTHNGWTQDTFDLASGMLISFSATAVGANIWTTGMDGGAIHSGARSTMLAIGLLKEIREPRLPGIGATFPDWFRNYRQLVFSGQVNLTVAGQPSGSMPESVVFDLDSFGSDYVVARSTSKLQAVSSDFISVAGTIGSLWMDPDYLSSLAAGKTIDEDTILGLTIRCASSDRKLVALSFKTGLAERVFGYDPGTGMLISLDTTQHIPPAIARTYVKFKSAT